MKNRPGRPPCPGICHLSLSVIGHWSFFNEKNSSGSHAAPCDREPRVSLLTGGWYGTSYGVHEGVFEAREGLRIADCRLRFSETAGTCKAESEIHDRNHNHPKSEMDSSNAISN